jgi:glycosyltransferase involved in cell wall biosynthesis
MVRLLAYTDATSFGGAEASLGNLLAALRSGIEITVLGTDAAVVDAIASQRPATRTRLVPAVRDKFDLAAIARHLRALRELRPDICQINLRTPNSSQYGMLAALSTRGVKVVAVEHLPMPTRSALRRWVKRQLSRRLSAHVAVGLRAARLVEEDAGLPAESIRTIYNGVPDSALVPLPRLAQGPVIGSLGRLDHQKGYDVLIEALALLPEASGVLVGDGPDREQLKQLARARSDADRLVVTGWSSEARRYLGGFDVFVLPSRYEGFPLAIIEAMLAGLPVVATDVGSVSECVQDGETGIVVPPDDRDALVDALRHLLHSVEFRQRLGASGRKRAESSFTAESMARSYEQLYAEIAS